MDVTATVNAQLQPTIDAVTTRVQDALTGIGITARSINVHISTRGADVFIHGPAGGSTDFTVAQALIAAGAIGATNPVFRDHGDAGYCVVRGTSPDGFEVYLFCLDPDGQDPAARLRPAPVCISDEEVGARVAVLSSWIDDHPANQARDREAQLWGRVAKVSEEAGEAIAALIGATGQNPRKGITGTYDDVRAELLDVAVSALAAVEHLDGNTGTSMNALGAHLEMLLTRADLATAAPVTSADGAAN